MLGDLEQNVDRTDSKLGDAMRRMRKFVRQTEGMRFMYHPVVPFGTYMLIRAETKSGWCIVILIIVLMILLLAVILV